MTGQDIVKEAFDALTAERIHEILLAIGIDDAFETCTDQRGQGPSSTCLEGTDS